MDKIKIKENALTIILSCSFLTLFLKNNYNSLCLIMFACYAIYTFFLNKKNNSNLDLKYLRVNILLILYFSISAISLMYSDNLIVGLAKISDVLPLLIVPFSFALLPNLKNNKIKYTIRILYIYGVLLILMFLFLNAVYKNAINGNSVLQFVYSFVRNTFNPEYPINKIEFWYFTYEGLTSIIDLQPIYLSLFINLAFIFLINLKENKIVQNILFYSLSVIFLLFNVLVSSRSGILVFFVIFGVYFLIYKATSVRVFIQNAVILLTFIFFSFIVLFSNPITKDRILSVVSSDYISTSSNFSNQNIRFEIWNSAISLIKISPVLGQGIGDYEELLYKTYRQDNFTQGWENKYNAHNQYLETTLQIGLVGLIILLLYFVKGFIHSYKIKNFEYMLILLTFLIGFCTESMFNRQWGIVSFTLFTCFVNKFRIEMKY
jgi:O-antigen ligase